MEEDALVPVFTSVNEVEFEIREKSPRQVVTLYNPYGYLVHYKVLCTAPSNYSVAESNGSLLAKRCKDVVVRCTSRLPPGNVDKLRIEIRKRSDNKLHGYKDILLKTVTEKTPLPQEAPSRSNFFGMSDSQTAGTSRHEDSRRGSENMQFGLIGIAIFCAICLLSPTVNDPSAASSVVPAYLHLSLPQKLVASYIMGVCSILILRPF